MQTNERGVWVNQLLALCVMLFAVSSVWGEQEDEKLFEGYTKLLKYRTHIELNADATYAQSFELVTKVLDKQGVEYANQYSVSYSSSMSEVEVIEAYTLKANGKRIDAPANNFQVKTNAGENGAAPMFSDIKTKTVVFPDVDVGDTVVFFYKLIQREAMFPGQFSFSQVFWDSYVVEDMEVSISAPELLPLRVETRNVEGGELEKMGGKRRWVWHFANRKIAKGEPGSVSAFDYAPRILVSTFKDYAELATAYESRAKPKAAITKRVQELAEEIAKGVKGQREIAKTLYNWVAKNINYAGNCIGIGAVVPHDTDRILDNKLGDCKDHTALLQALLAAKGIESTPVLVNSSNVYSLPELPIAGVFDHVINYIPSLNMYVDSTSADTPFGMLPITEEGKPVIHTAKFDGIKWTPPPDNKIHWGRMRAEITFRPDGSADGKINSTSAGIFAISSRVWFKRLTPIYRESVVQNALSSQGFKGGGKYLKVDDPDVQNETFNFEVEFHVENGLNLPGPGATYVYPLLPSHGVSISTFLGSLNSEKRSHGFACTGGAANEEMIFHFPKGVKILAIPKSIRINDKYGSYESKYKQKGNTIISTRKIIDNTPSGVCPPELGEEFKPFQELVMRDLRSQIIFQ